MIGDAQSPQQKSDRMSAAPMSGHKYDSSIQKVFEFPQSPTVANEREKSPLRKLFKMGGQFKRASRGADAARGFHDRSRSIQPQTYDQPIESALGYCINELEPS